MFTPNQKTRAPGKNRCFPLSLRPGGLHCFFGCIGGALFFHYTHGQKQVLLANVTLDQALRDVLMENENTQWEKKDRMDRLAALLRNRGVKVTSLDGVVLARVYSS